MSADVCFKSIYLLTRQQGRRLAFVSSEFDYKTLVWFIHSPRFVYTFNWNLQFLARLNIYFSPENHMNPISLENNLLNVFPICSAARNLIANERMWLFDDTFAVIVQTFSRSKETFRLVLCVVSSGCQTTSSRFISPSTHPLTWTRKFVDVSGYWSRIQLTFMSFHGVWLCNERIGEMWMWNCVS